jgi:predicted RNA polymerase sigma factor
MPDEPEALGLLALMLLHDARRAARVDDAGVLVPLDQQDRARWNHDLITEGIALLHRVQGRPGPYRVQAAIAACHATAASVRETDWERIVLLYEALGRLAPSPVVELNRAVAISVAQGPAAALPVVDDLVAAGSLSGSHLLPSVRGELLSRLGRTEEARREIESAIRLCGNARERGLLQLKLAALG